MTSQVTARARRPLSFDMFADMLDAEVLSLVPNGAGQVTVTFDRALTVGEVASVTARLTSADDADMADRSALWGLHAEVAALSEDPTRTLLLNLVSRVLDA